MKTIRRIVDALLTTLAAWAFLRHWHRTEHGDWPVPPTSEVPWQAEQAEALEVFLRSPAGHVMLAHLRCVDLRTCAFAVYGDPKKREYHCGYAAGVRATVSYLVTLSTTRPAANAGTEQDGAGAADLLERLAP